MGFQTKSWIQLFSRPHNLVGIVYNRLVTVNRIQNIWNIGRRITGHFGNSFLISPSNFLADECQFLRVSQRGFFGFDGFLWHFFDLTLIIDRMNSEVSPPKFFLLLTFFFFGLPATKFSPKKITINTGYKFSFHVFVFLSN